MRLKDLWALLKDSWNAWSADKAPRSRPFPLLPSWSSSLPSRLSSSDKRQY